MFQASVPLTILYFLFLCHSWIPFMFEWTTLKRTVKAIQKDIKVLYVFIFGIGNEIISTWEEWRLFDVFEKRPLIIIRDYGYLLMKATKTIISKVYNVSCNFKLLWRLSSTDTSHTVCILMETSFYSEKQWKKEKIWKWLKKQVSFIFFISFYRLTLKNIILHQTCLILKRCNVNI